MKKPEGSPVLFDGEEYYPVPGFPSYYVSTSLKVIKDDHLLTHVKYAKGYAYTAINIRHGQPHVSIYLNGGRGYKAYCKPVARLLYMVQTGMSDQAITRLYPKAHFEQLADGTVRITDACDIYRKNLIKGARIWKEIRESKTPQKSLDNLRAMEKLFAALIEDGNPEPLMKYMEGVRDNTTIPYLRNFGTYRAIELANEAMQETLSAILRGWLPSNIPAYMNRVAKCMWKRRRRDLQKQFADLLPSAERKAAAEDVEETYWSILY